MKLLISFATTLLLASAAIAGNASKTSTDLNNVSPGSMVTVIVQFLRKLSGVKWLILVLKPVNGCWVSVAGGECRGYPIWRIWSKASQAGVGRIGDVGLAALRGGKGFRAPHRGRDARVSEAPLNYQLRWWDGDGVSVTS